MTRSLREFTAIMAFACYFGSTLLAQDPQWWTQRRFINPGKPPDDFAAANIGQLKHAATAAAAQLNAIQSGGGAGSAITSMIAAWSGSQTADDYAAVTIGQAKAVAVKFYDRLQELGVPAQLPWDPAGTNASDYSPLNLGQLKTLFSFTIPPSLDPTFVPLVDRGPRSVLNYGSPAISTTPKILRSTGVSGGLYTSQEESVTVVAKHKSFSYDYGAIWWGGSNGANDLNVSYNDSPIVKFHREPYASDLLETNLWTFYRNGVSWESNYRPIVNNNYSGLSCSSYYVNLKASIRGGVEYATDVVALDDAVMFHIELPPEEPVRDHPTARKFIIDKQIHYYKVDSYHRDPTPLDPTSSQEFVDTEHEFPGFPQHVRQEVVLTIGENMQRSPDVVVQTSLSSSPANGEAVNLTITMDETVPPSSGAGLRMKDIAGPAHRKIGLNGVPMPDEPPQKEEESDQPREESFIDGYTMGLQHSTSDVYVPLGASSLPLQANRCAEEYSWTPGAGPHPQDLLTQPFGIGWNSGLTSYVEIKSVNGSTIARVSDENGCSQSFILNSNGKYDAMPFSSTDAKGFLNRLEKQGGKLIYIKKYGTTLTFDVPAGQSITPPTTPWTGDNGEVATDPEQTPFSVSTIPSNSGAAVTFGQGDTIFSPNASARLLSFDPGSSATESGLAWDARKLDHMPAWQVAVWDRTNSASAYQSAVRHPLEVRTQRMVPDTEYSAGVKSAMVGTIRQPAALPTAWLTAAPSISSPYYPSSSAVSTYSPMSPVAHEGYMAAANAGGVFLEAPLKPFTPEEKGAVLRGAATGLGSVHGSQIIPGGRSFVGKADWISGYDAGIARAIQQVTRTAAQLPAAQGTSLQAFQNAGEQVGQGVNQLSSVDSTPLQALRTPPSAYSPPGNTINIGDASYYRLVKAEDRTGNTLSYTYGSNDTLIPTQISDPKRSNVALNVVHDGKRISKIIDPAGNEVTYRYRKRSIGGDNCTLLERVTYADGSFVHYGYDHDGKPAAGSQNMVHHVNLGAILDPEGHAWSFTYGFDRTREDLTMGYAATPNGGMPRVVTSVTQPDGKRATFLNDRVLTLTTGHYMLGRVANSVQDVDGNIRSYVYGGAEVANGEIDSGTQWASGIENYLMFTTLDIHLGENLVERFEFDPEAGLALKRAIDLSGNITEYQYEDGADYRTSHPTPVRIATPLNLFKRLNDPTTKTRCHYSPGTPATKITDSVTQYTYELNTRVMNSTTDPMGRKTEFNVNSSTGLRLDERHYDEQHNLVAKTEYSYANTTFPGFLTQTKVFAGSGDPEWAADLVTVFTANSTGRVETQAVPAISATTTYHYDAVGHKKEVIDPRGKVTAFGYDKRGRVTSATYAQGTADEARKDFTYDARGNKIAEVDENNVIHFYSYDEMNRCRMTVLDLDGNGLPGDLSHDIVTLTEYNAFGQPTTITDPNGSITVHEYDGLGRLAVTRSAAGTVSETLTRMFYEQGENIGGSIFDSSSFRPSRVVDARGYQTVTQYDALSRPVKTWQQYNPVASGNAHGSWALTETEYDLAGNPISQTDPLGKITRTVFDSLNRPVKVTYADNTFTTATYTGTGLKWQTTDEMGRVSETHYDGGGRAVLSVKPAVTLDTNTTAIPTVATGYDAAGNITSVTDERGQTTVTAYDSRNRVSSITMPAVLDGISGQMVRPTVIKYYDPAGLVVRETDPLGANTDSYYDRASRVIKRVAPPVLSSHSPTQPEAGITLTSYDMAGHVTSINDAEQRVTQNFYDPLGRLVQTNFANVISAIFAYDEAGNRTLVVDGNGNATTFTYDGLNRVILEQAPATSAPTMYYYNAMEQIARKTPEGQTISYAYDDRHRLITTSLPGNTRTSAYDDVGNLLSASESADSQKNVSYTYDSHNRTTSETSAGITHSYAYDAAGNRTVVQYGGLDASVLGSTYDALNRLTALNETPAQGSVRTSTWEYDAAGRVHAQNLANGTRVQNLHDAQGRLTLRTLQSPASSGDIRTTLNTQTYLYDRTGYLRKMTEIYPGQTTPRSVDLWYQPAVWLQDSYLGQGIDDGRLRIESIREADSTLTTTTVYDYDQAGNRITGNVSDTSNPTGVLSQYQYNAANQLTWFRKGTEAAVTFTYDANGNRITRTQDTQIDHYTWDAENRLASVDHAATAKTYAYGYDYRCRRVQRDEGTAHTAIVFSGGTSVQEYALASATPGTTAPSKTYVRGSDMGGGIGGLLYSRDTGSQPTFDHYNGRGDVVAKTDSTGSVTWTGGYEAFGKRTHETGTNTDRQRANTKEEDPTGLLNEGRRYRELETGTWLSRDPAGFVDGPNLYAYVQQNPWTKFDPLGLESFLMGSPFDSRYNMGNSEYRQGFRRGMAQGFVIGASLTAGVASTVLTEGAAGPYVISVLGEGTLATSLTTAAVSGAVGGATSQATTNVLTGQPVGQGVPKAAATGALLNFTGAGAAQVSKAVALAAREDLAIEAAVTTAEAAKASGATGGAANAMVTIDGQVFTGLSKNAGGGPVSDSVAGLYGSARTTCAEARTLTAMEEAGANPQGATSAAASVGVKNAPMGTPMQACKGACAPVLKEQGVGDAVAGTKPASSGGGLAPVPVPASGSSEPKVEPASREDDNSD